MNRYLITFGIIIIAFGSRYYKISEPEHVCWDETHFGKMGSWYINRTFFFDVHPPLGKMLIALSGYLTGYDGKFAFEKPGDKYENVSYTGMRFFCASLGASIIPMSFETVHELTHSLRASILAAIFLLCDVGLITLTQYILLDPILLCFISGSLLGTAKMTSDSIFIFSKTWWFWHLFTGIMLSCCISVKFVGLFTILFVGLCTVIDLWTILGDLKKSMKFFGKYFLAKALTLIVWPIILYSIIFYIHLHILNKSGNGDGFYSTAFQSQLQGNSMFNISMPQKIAYGSIITLKNNKIGGGYLHSHYHLYPEDVGVKQQQVTTYTYKDDNNKWLIKKFDEDYKGNVEIVQNGDLIRLEHVLTKRNLHSHNHQGPLTKKQFQVTGYGDNGTGDANDVWKIVLIDGHENQEIKIISDRIQLIHFLQSCVLTTTGKQLPKWAFEQQEVTCNPNLRDSNSMWNIEENEFEKLEKVNVQVYAPNFLQKFLESHAVMIKGNAGLKPKEGEVTSKPWQWPLNLKGQFFSGGNYRIYLLGNPVIWWMNLLLLVIFIIRYIINVVYEQRNNWQNEQNKHIKASLYLFLGWCLHYLPFYLMSRILYYHHYYPALIFSSLLSAVVLNQIVEELIIIIPMNNFVLDHILNAIIVSAIVYSFIGFSPLSYGMDEIDQLQHLKWLDSWEF